MAKEAFKEISFRATSLAIIAQADQIIREYQGRGFTLTLRQLYYQFVSRDLLPNTQAQYKRLGGIVNDARIAGKLDWSAIEDRTRNVKNPYVWENPAQVVRSLLGGRCGFQSGFRVVKRFVDRPGLA